MAKGKPQGRYGILTPHHKKWQSVFDQLYFDWRHPPTAKQPRPRKIVRILGVTPPRHLVTRYNKYRSAVEKQGRFSRKGMSKGNEKRRWHGTPAKCKFFHKNLRSKGRCDDKSCPICSIINTGFRIPKPKKGKFERFGLGIYLSSTASKSDGYTGFGARRPAKGVRAILLCRVVVGRGKKIYVNDPNRTKAPKGYNSVLGEPGIVLDYDELVVYNPAAVLPAYVVVYK